MDISYKAQGQKNTKICIKYLVFVLYFVINKSFQENCKTHENSNIYCTNSDPSKTPHPFFIVY